MRHRLITLALVAAAAAAAALLAALPAAACPVCYGEAKGAAIDGARWSVVFLGGLTYTLFGGAAAMVIAVRRRVRAAQDAEDEHHPSAKTLPFAAAANEVKESHGHE